MDKPESLIADQAIHYKQSSSHKAVQHLAAALGITVELAERGCAELGDPSMVRHAPDKLLRRAFGSEAAQRIIAWRNFAHASLHDLRGQLATSRAVIAHMQSMADIKSTESVWIICANAQMRIISVTELCSGDANKADVSVRAIARIALAHEAVGVIMVHNHPSGSAGFSNADMKITQEVSRALQSLEIKLFDHVLITSRECVSMLDLGILPDKGD